LSVATTQDVLRFSLTQDSPVAVVGPDNLVPDSRTKAKLPDVAALLEWLESVPARRVPYALTLDHDASARLRESFRLVVSEPGAGDLYALREQPPPNAGFASDGLPFPPPEMIRLVAGLHNPHRFYQRFIQGGAQVAQRFKELLERNRLQPQELGSALDFGCGCGRVIRHWGAPEGLRLHGSDYNPYLVEWCAANLPFAKFTVNDLEPGLDYPDEHFGLVYSYSVFTHLPEELAERWLAELVRVTAPGGHLILTFNGQVGLDQLDAAQRAKFAAGELVVVTHGEDAFGSNACAAYHPKEYVRDRLAASLDVIDHLPGDDHVRLDCFLLRKPAVTTGDRQAAL
jgi:SAM-dependent methyltransferase